MLYLNQKRLLFILGGLLTFLFLFLFYIQPTIKGIRDLEKRIAHKKSELAEIVSLGRGLLDVREELSSLKASAIGREEREMLASVISQLAETAGAKGNLNSIELTERGLLPGFSGNEVVVKFEGISWERLKDFLSNIEKEQAILHLKRLSLKGRYDNPSLLDSTITIFVLERK